MKMPLSASLFFSFSVLFGLNSANATLVQSALTPNQIGISADQLMATTMSNVALPPWTSNGATFYPFTKGIHLGTNTDLFKSFNNQYYLRYTLDPSSNEQHIHIEGYATPAIEISTAPISGELWLQFDIQNQIFKAYDHKTNQALNLFNSYDSQARGIGDIHPLNNQGNLKTLVHSAEYNGQTRIITPETNAYLDLTSDSLCIECSYDISLNLAFLELRWNGSTYNLFTSAEGFDQILSAKTSFNDWSSTTNLNIAPVPVPAATWLLGSGLIGLIGIARRRN